MSKGKKVLYCTGISLDKPLIYVIRGNNGDMLIDTGSRFVARQIDRWIKKNRFRIKWIFLTHGHFDHTWNALYFRQKLGAEVIMHEKDRDIFCLNNKHLLNPATEKNKAITNIANKLLLQNDAPFCKIDIFITDKDTGYLRTLGFDADIVMLPGHTAGSMGILQGRVLYAGDAISAKGGEYYTAMFGENIQELFKTEKKIFELNPLVIAPGHGQLVINEHAFI